MTTNTKTRPSTAPCDLEPGDQYVPAQRALKLVEILYYDWQRPEAGAVVRSLHGNDFDIIAEMPILGWMIPGKQRLSSHDCPLPLPWPVLADGPRDPLEPHYPWAVVSRDRVYDFGAWHCSLDNWFQDALHVMEIDEKVRGTAHDD